MTLTYASIKAHYSFENNQNDDSANGYTLSVTGTPTYPTGKVGTYCVDYEASDGTIPYSYRADNADFSVAGNVDFFIAAWIKPESLTTEHEIVTKWGASGSYEYRLFISSGFSDYPSFSVSSDGTNVTTVQSATGITEGNWYYIMAWHDATADKIYISVNNGTPDEAAHATGVYDGASNFVVAATAAGTSTAYDGSIDQLIFAKAIPSADDRTFLYNSGNGRTWTQIQNNYTDKRITNIGVNTEYVDTTNYQRITNLAVNYEYVDNSNQIRTTNFAIQVEYVLSPTGRNFQYIISGA